MPLMVAEKLLSRRFLPRINVEACWIPAVRVGCYPRVADTWPTCLVDAGKLWFPWNTDSSPGFDIALFWILINQIFVYLYVITSYSAEFISLLLPLSYLRILNYKFKYIRAISIERIKDRKLKESGHAGTNDTVVIDFCKYAHQSCRPDHTLQGGPFIERGASMDIVGLLHPLEEDVDIRSVVVREDVSLQGDQYKPRAAAFITRTVDNLALISPLHISSGARRNLGVKDTEQRDLGSLKLTRDISSSCNKAIDVLSAHEASCIKATNELNSEMSNVLAENIVLYQKIIRYVESLGTDNNAILTVIFIDVLMAMAITALVITEVNASFWNFKLVSVVLTTFVLAGYLALNNMAQLLYDQHDELVESMYSSDWLEASPSFKKSLVIVMTRASVPLQIKPTGLNSLSRAHFSFVMKDAYQMIATLNKVAK